MFWVGGASGFSRDKTDAERQVGEDLQLALGSQDGRWDLTKKLHNRDHLQITLQILRANATHHTFTHLRRTSPMCGTVGDCGVVSHIHQFHHARGNVCCLSSM